MSGMERFYIGDVVNEGIIFPLVTPSNEKTEHWLKVLSRFSDSYKQTEAKHAWADIISEVKLDDLTGRQTKDALKERRLHKAAALVADWSFDEKCTEENKIAFFEKAPQILEMVEYVANRLDFFVKKK